MQGELTRLAIDHREKDHGKALLHLGVLVELIQDDLCFRTALEADDDAHTVTVTLIAEIVFGNIGDDFIVDQFGNALDQFGFVDLIGNLGDDDRLPAALQLFDRCLGAHKEAPSAGFVGLGDTSAPIDETAGRKVRALHVLQHFGQTCLRVLDQLDGGADHLVQIVGRNIGRHAYGDSVGSVHDQIGNAGRQHRGFEGAFVVVGNEVDASPDRCRPSSHRQCGSCGIRCSAWPRADHRRRNRSFPGRPPWDSAC